MPPILLFFLKLLWLFRVFHVSIHIFAYYRLYVKEICIYGLHVFFFCLFSAFTQVFKSSSLYLLVIYSFLWLNSSYWMDILHIYPFTWWLTFGVSALLAIINKVAVDINLYVCLCTYIFIFLQSITRIRMSGSFDVDVCLYV